MFDDRIGNLVVPRDLGMRTVLIAPPNDAKTFQAPRHVDAITDNLASFLRLTLNTTNVL